MRKILQSTHLKMAFLCFTAFMASVLIHCGQVYDNPVSDKFEGDYKCIITWNSLTANAPEILKSYIITVTDTGKDKYHKFELTTEPAVRLNCEPVKSNANEHTIKLLFQEPFNGKLSLVAIRPNLKKDSYSTNVTIVNPYRVSGDSLVGRNIPANLFISRIDTIKAMDTDFLVIWDTSSIPFDSVLIGDSVSLRYGNQDSVKVNATISIINGSYKLPPYTLRFQGHAPVIEYAFLRDAPLRFGTAPVIDIKFSDDDTGIVTFSVFATAHNKLLTSVPYNATGDSTAIFCDEMVSDTIPTSLSIIAIDKDGLSSEPKIIDSLNVSFTKPEVEFLNSSDTLFFKYGTSPRFFAEGEADSFLWIIDNGALIKSTKENSIELNPIMDTLWHTIKLTGVNLTSVNGYYLKSKEDRVIYKAKYSKYSIEKISFPSSLKIKKWYFWEVRTVDAIGSNIGSDSLKYVWTYPKDNGCADSLNEDSSGLFLYFPDSVKSFTIEVKAIVGNDSTSLETTVPLIGEVTTHVYKPECVFDSINSDTVKLNDSVGIKVHIKTTDPDGCPVDTVFYSVKSPANSFIEKKDTSDAWGYKFKEKGWYTIITWVTDSDKNRSDYDTMKVYVSTDKPVFNPLILKKTVYAKDSLLLTATTETDPDSILKYLWDLDNNGAVDKETDSNFIFTQFDNACICTLKVNCINISNEFAVQPLVIVVTVLSNNPVIKSVTHSNPVYINDKCTFTVHAEDYGKNKDITKYLVSTDSVIFSPMADSSFDTAFKSPGKKYLYFKVVDNLNLPSIYYRDTVFVRSGEPVISDIAVKYNEDSLYVKDNFDISFITKDTNGTISKVCVSWNNDTIAEDSIIYVPSVPACTSKISYAFDTSSYGNRTVKIWAVDDDKQKKTDSTKIKISKGAPVIKSLLPMETWVKKTTRFTVKASDPNSDTVKVREIKFDSGGSWIPFTTDTVTYEFDTMAANPEKSIWVRVTDEDGISTIQDYKVRVNMGRPVVGRGSNNDDLRIRWFYGDGKTVPDTMVYVYSLNNNNSNIMVNAADSNGGKCVQFKWSFIDGMYPVKTTDTNFIQVFIEKHTLANISVTATDNDGIPSKPYTFFVFPDEVPPEPISFQNGISGDSVILKWGRKQDSYDGMDTRVQIMICQGGECDPSNPLFSELPTLTSLETKYGKETIDEVVFNRVALIPGFSGLGRWKVILIDCHNNQTAGIASFVTP